LVHWSPFDLLYQPQMMDDDECGAFVGIIGRGNGSTWRKHAPLPLCTPKIPHDLTSDRTWGRHSGKPATNRLNYGTAEFRIYQHGDGPNYSGYDSQL
jgi:hypothetical protein